MTPMNGIAKQYKNMVWKWNGSKNWVFAGFCHHCLAIMSVHMYVYHYPLLESEMKTCLWTITLSIKYIVLAVKWTQRTAVNYVDYSSNDNWYIAGYGDYMQPIKI